MLINISGTTVFVRINRKRRLEKFVDSCVVNKTCISLTSVTEKNSFTTKLANNVDTSAINVRAAEAVLHLEERISGADYSVIVMI